jgi:hypothetical protein
LSDRGNEEFLSIIVSSKSEPDGGVARFKALLTKEEANVYSQNEISTRATGSGGEDASRQSGKSDQA